MNCSKPEMASWWAATIAGLIEIVLTPDNGGYRFRALGDALGLAMSGVNSIAEDQDKRDIVAFMTLLD